MEERWNRSKLVTIVSGVLFVFTCGFLFGANFAQSLPRKASPHVAEIYCNEESLGKLYVVFSNSPFVGVKEFPIEKGE